VYGQKGLYRPDGEIVRLHCAQIFTFRGERIIEHRVEYDTLELRRNLGRSAGETSA
jgi:ketosteroid isomerase-like protein